MQKKHLQLHEFFRQQEFHSQKQHGHSTKLQQASLEKIILLKKQ